MNRRNTLLAIGGALPLAMLARTIKAEAAPAITVTNWKNDTLQYGTLAKTTSMVAVERSTNQYVIDFAHSEIDEQTGFAQVLTASASPPPYPLTAAQIMIRDSVKNASDADFDSTYIAVQIAGHKHLLSLMLTLKADGLPYTAAAMQQAIVAEAFIKTHLKALSLLQAANQ